jgi:hypothetical protein
MRRKMASILSRTQDSRFLMLTCLATAACSAVGHHCFYQSLRGQRVDEQKFDQNLNVYIGTALTVLTKLSLSATVTLAYSQILWQRLLGQRLRISHIDSLSSLVTTPSALDDWRILRKFPLLTTLAMMAWCTPIITVFPPGTLSVVADLANSTVSASVPSMDFTHALISDNSSRSMGRSRIDLEPDDNTGFTFPAGLKASAGVLAAMTAFTGSIPRIQTAEINSSYSTTFFGPALRCSTKQVKTNHVYCSGDAELSYISFMSFPQDKGTGFRRYFDLNASVPVYSSGNTSAIACSSIASFRSSTFGVYPPQLFVVARTSIPDLAPDSDPLRQEWKATTCQLRNATYEVEVQTSGNNQVVTVKANDDSSLGLATGYIPGIDTSSVDLTGPSANKLYNYFAMMAAMGQIVVGTVNSGSDVTTQMYTDGGVVDITPAPFPGIFSTRLSSSPEIQAFAKFANSPRVGDSHFASAGEGSPLAQQLEELFRNMTVAMLTSPATSSNATVEVSHWSSVIIYKYTAWHLWLAYGIGLLAAVLIIFLGFAAISVNGASYSTKFSTYLRTAPLSIIDEVLSDDRDTGADPLPKDVARRMMMLRCGSAIASMEMTGAKYVSDGSSVERHNL